ncbi:hypothetical protein H2248_009416 [Termitomyces sp. 'cryptogamus']|nr:hypothetical protein H2248_009416 [Termitomyces sp. 'cryptogamus']
MREPLTAFPHGSSNRRAQEPGPSRRIKSPSYGKTPLYHQSPHSPELEATTFLIKSTPSLTAADERIGKSACEEILPPTSLETLAIDFPSNIEGLSVSKVPEDWLWSENYRQLWKKAPTV